jgi:transcriptional regulator with XRE-family HTH domain
MKQFGERLKLLRNEAEEKQKDIAELLGCTLRHYQAIEAGEINIPSKKLELLADHFYVSMDYLMGRTDRREINR